MATTSPDFANSMSPTLRPHDASGVTGSTGRRRRESPVTTATLDTVVSFHAAVNYSILHNWTYNLHPGSVLTSTSSTLALSQTRHDEVRLKKKKETTNCPEILQKPRPVVNSAAGGHHVSEHQQPTSQLKIQLDVDCAADRKADTAPTSRTRRSNVQSCQLLFCSGHMLLRFAHIKPM